MCARSKLLFAETRANKYTRAKEGQSVPSCLFFARSADITLRRFVRSLDGGSIVRCFARSDLLVERRSAFNVHANHALRPRRGNVNAWLTAGASRRTGVVTDIDRHTRCHRKCAQSRLLLALLSFFLGFCLRFGMASISPLFPRVYFMAQRWLDLIPLTGRSLSIIISFSVSCHISSSRRHAASESRRFMAGKVTEIASLSRKARSRENFDLFFSLFLFFLNPPAFPSLPSRTPLIHSFPRWSG